jgi:hypothetical protein
LLQPGCAPTKNLSSIAKLLQQHCRTAAVADLAAAAAELLLVQQRCRTTTARNLLPAC